MCRWMASATTAYSGYSFRPTLDQVDGQTLMGRSVLGHSGDGGANYTYIGELSRSKFINASVEPGHIDRAAPQTGLAIRTPVLWIFGSGRYRMSDIYLAVMPLAGFPLSPIFYFTGNGWSSDEATAAPLFCAGDVGELSVRWNRHLRRWLALFNSGNPRGILMHSALNPWGPWSVEPVMIFDLGALADPSNPCSVAGHGRFSIFRGMCGSATTCRTTCFRPITFATMTGAANTALTRCPALRPRWTTAAHGYGS